MWQHPGVALKLPSGRGCHGRAARTQSRAMSQCRRGLPAAPSWQPTVGWPEPGRELKGQGSRGAGVEVGGQLPCAPRPAERPCACAQTCPVGRAPVPAQGAEGRALPWLRPPVAPTRPGPTRPDPGCVEERDVGHLLCLQCAQMKGEGARGRGCRFPPRFFTGL